jgi:hypothetical protein
MFIPFSSMPAHARVWIYQASKELTSAEQHILTEGLTSFTHQWNVHGNPIETSFSIHYNRFIILAANDQVSGCSIDSSVHAMKALAAQIEVDFFNRTEIPFLKEDRVETYPLAKLKQAFENGTLAPDSLTFDNQVTTIKDLTENWIIPAKSSWLKRYLT